MLVEFRCHDGHPLQMSCTALLRFRSISSSPIQNQHLLRHAQSLHLLRCDRHIVVETETHMLVRLGMMSRWPDYRKGVPDLSCAYRYARLDDTSAGETSTMCCLAADVERELLIVVLGLLYRLIGHV